ATTVLMSTQKVKSNNTILST
ncbi:sulfatase family protein, partial [Vibrio parahaemolyticus EKP-021]